MQVTSEPELKGGKELCGYVRGECSEGQGQ